MHLLARRIMAGFLLMLLGCGQAGAAVCRDDSIQEVNSAYLWVTSGWLFALFPGSDLRIGGTWLPLDHLKICRLGGASYEITDLDRDGEHTIGIFLN